MMHLKLIHLNVPSILITVIIVPSATILLLPRHISHISTSINPSAHLSPFKTFLMMIMLWFMSSLMVLSIHHSLSHSTHPRVICFHPNMIVFSRMMLKGSSILMLLLKILILIWIFILVTSSTLGIFSFLIYVF